MHGVKRLFAWMIPRFDAERYNVSLVSLRKKDLSEETLESIGVDITYLHKSKFDPATLPALLKVIDRKKIDILHLHGYGATTFGRIAGAMRSLPTIVHEHANLTDTPWFQKIADTALEPVTDIAIASRQRFRHALDAVGPEFAGLLVDVCCFLKRLDDVERERQWPARSAKVVLQLGLDRLARHFGLTRAAHGKARADITTWLAPGASFTVETLEAE